MSADTLAKNPARWIALLSFLVLIPVGVAVLWWLFSTPPRVPGPDGPLAAGRLEPFRTEGGTLHTNGIIKTEELRKARDSWRGTTSSGIRLDATYRYEIELRNEWNFYIDDTRKLAFVVAPPYKPQLPVAVDSRSVQEWTSAGWGRFDKWEHLQDLRREITPLLETKARSKGYMELARGDARKTVEDFTADWFLRQSRLSQGSQYTIKVYFSDEADIPFPDNKKLKDFLP